MVLNYSINEVDISAHLPQAIFLDTNVLYRIPARSTESSDVGFPLLREVCDVLGIPLLTSMLSTMELVFKRLEEAKQCCKNVTQGIPRIEYLTGVEYPELELPIFSRQDVHRQVDEFLKFNDIRVIEVPCSLVSPSILEKAAYKQPPFSPDQRDRGFCDCVIFETCRAFMEASGNEWGVLVTDDRRFLQFCRSQKRFTAVQSFEEACDLIEARISEFDRLLRERDEARILGTLECNLEHVLDFVRKHARITEFLLNPPANLFSQNTKERDLPEGVIVDEIISFQPTRISSVRLLATKASRTDGQKRALVSVATAFEIQISFSRYPFFAPPIDLSKETNFSEARMKLFERESKIVTVERDLYVTAYLELSERGCELAGLREGFDIDN